MGFFDSTSKSSSSTASAAGQTEEGSPLSSTITAGKGSSINITQEILSEPLVALTDNISGAVLELGERGFASADLALGAGVDLSRDALELARDQTREVFDFASELSADSARFRDLAVEKQTRIVEESLRFAGDRAGEVKSIATTAVIENASLVDDVLARAFSLSERSFELADEQAAGDVGRFQSISERALLIGGGVAALAVVALIFKR